MKDVDFGHVEVFVEIFASDEGVRRVSFGAVSAIPGGLGIQVGDSDLARVPA